MENTHNIYSSVTESAYGLSIGAVWQHISIVCSDISGDYLFRKQIFFDFLTRALAEKKIKLASKGIFLSGSISDQLNLFQITWQNIHLTMKMMNWMNMACGFLSRLPLD